MMRGAANRMFPLSLMLALALLTFWLDRAVRDELVHPSLRRHDPDFIISNFHVTQYDREGRVESTLTARQMRHFPDDDTTEIDAPVVVQTKPDTPRMTLTADRGALSQDGVDVFLRDNVVVVREAREPNDLRGFRQRYPSVEHCCLNGATAGAVYARLPAAVAPGLPATVLPSTSPAHARLRLAEKLERWRVALAPFLAEPEES